VAARRGPAVPVGARSARTPIREHRPAEREQGLGSNPLDTDGGLDLLAVDVTTGATETDAFYGAPPPTMPPPPLATTSTTTTTSTPAKRPRARGRQPLPDGRTFRLVTFSFYEEDVARLDALLKAARQKGHRKASRSQIVRLALRHVDLDGLPEDI
jgi:hypothetical protein